MPGTVINRWQGRIVLDQRFDVGGQTFDALVEPAPVASQSLDHVHHARRQDVGARSEDLRKPGSQEAQPLAHGNAALQQKGADLIDYASDRLGFAKYDASVVFFTLPA